MGAFTTGTYRNIFKETGKSENDIRQKLQETIDTFFYGDENERIYHAVGEDMGYLEDTGNHDVRTEGMSYGMMICVQLDMKEEFDRIWKWSKTYMYLEQGENAGYFAWSCKVTGEKNACGPAPDGEEYFAMALFFCFPPLGRRRGHSPLFQGGQKPVAFMPAQGRRRKPRSTYVEPGKQTNLICSGSRIHRSFLPSASLL